MSTLPSLPRPAVVGPVRRMPSRLVVLLALTLLVRVASLLWLTRHDVHLAFSPDSYGYDAMARALVHTGHFAPDPEHAQVPEIIRTPGYPVFLAAFYLPFGDDARAALVGQVVLSLATIVAVFSLGRRLWGESAGFAAALLLVLDPRSFLSSQLLLTESLFSLLVVLTVYASVAALERPGRLLPALAAGFCLAAATHVRPLLLYLVVPLIGLILLCARRKRVPARRAVLTVGVLLLPWAALVGGWQYRNWRMTGSWKFSHIDGINLLLYRGAGIVAMRDGLSLEEAQQAVTADLPDANHWSQAQEMAVFRKRGLALIEAEPLLFLHLQASGLARMVLTSGMEEAWAYFGERLPTGPLGDLRRLSLHDYISRWLFEHPFALALLALGEVQTAFYYALMAIGCLLAARERDRRMIHGLLLLLIVYLFIVPAGPEAYSRFVVPIMPLIVLYAGAGLATLIRMNPATVRAPTLSARKLAGLCRGPLRILAAGKALARRRGAP